MSKTTAQLENLFTPEELALIREQNAKYQRDFWGKMTPDERRKKRALYALHVAKNKQKQAQEQENAAD